MFNSAMDNIRFWSTFQNSINQIDEIPYFDYHIFPCFLSGEQLSSLWMFLWRVPPVGEETLAISRTSVIITIL